VHGHRSERQTLDLDFAFTVQGWDQFHSLRSSLAGREDFREDAEKPHRIYFVQPEVRVPLDLLPFGSRIETREGIVPWLPGATVQLNMVGFDDALRNSVSVAVTQEVTLAVASLPMIAALKLFAWEDRRKFESSKDAEDLAELLVTYEKAGNANRLCGDDYELLAAAEHDMTQAGACLLGRDLARVASSNVMRHLLRLLSDPDDRNHLCTRMFRSPAVRGMHYVAVESLLTAFERGLKSDSGRAL
jgi:predicted nucleotidyltransferase